MFKLLTDQLHVASANSLSNWLYLYIWLTKSSIQYLSFLFINIFITTWQRNSFRSGWWWWCAM